MAGQGGSSPQLDVADVETFSSPPGDGSLNSSSDMSLIAESPSSEPDSEGFKIPGSSS